MFRQSKMSVTSDVRSAVFLISLLTDISMSAIYPPLNSLSLPKRPIPAKTPAHRLSLWRRPAFGHIRVPSRSSPKVKKLVITLTLAAGLCGAFVWLPVVCGQNNPPAARAAKPVGPSRIAFVDMDQILRSYKKSADVRDEVKAFEDAANAKLGQMLNEGRELEKDRKSVV